MPEQQKPINVLWDRLAALDPAEAAARAAVAHDPAQQAYLIPLLDLPIAVRPAVRRVEAPSGPAPYDVTLICVQYLLTSRDEPPAGEPVGPRTLPYGDFFFRGLHQMPTAKLEAAFGNDLARFRSAALALGGRPLAIADAAYQLDALPRVPVTIALWAADDEFPARSQFLLDKRADRQLPLDALWLLCGIVAKRLLAAQEPGTP